MPTVKRTMILPEHEGGSVIDSAHRAANDRIRIVNEQTALHQKRIRRATQRIQTSQAAIQGLDVENQRARQDALDRINGLLRSKEIPVPFERIQVESPDPKRPYDVALSWEEEAPDADPSAPVAHPPVTP